MRRPKAQLREFTFGVVWPRPWMMRVICWGLGHVDVWRGDYLPTLGYCRYCGKNLSKGAAQ